MSLTSAVPALARPAAVPAAGHGAGAGTVRVTVLPGEEVLLPAGTPLGRVRSGLAELLRRPELRHASLTADGVPVADGDLVGARPLLPGATLRVAGESVAPEADGLGSRGERDAVLRHPWLVARADGPRAGTVRGLVPGTTTLASARVRVAARRTDRVHVRGPLGGPVPDRVYLRRRSRRSRVGPVSRRWRPDAVLEAGGELFTLHPSGDADRWLAPADPSGTGSSSTGSSAPDAPASGGLGLAATAVVPVVGSLALAAVLRQPVYALFALVGVLALVPQLLAARRRRGARAGHGPAAPAPAPPAEHPGGAPGPLLARVVATSEASDETWRRAVAQARSAARAAASTSEDPVRSLVPDGALAVVGPPGPARAVARAVVTDLASRGAAVDVTGAGRDVWSWCRWLPAGGPRVVVVDEADGALRADRPPGAVVVLLCLSPDAAVPAWCRSVWRVRTDGSVHRAGPDGTDETGPLVGVAADWCEHVARLLAAAAGLGRAVAGLYPAAHQRLDAIGGGLGGGPDVAGAAGPVVCDPTDPRLPGQVSLAGLLGGSTDGSAGGPSSQDAGGLWDRTERRPGWSVPLGVDARGTTVTLDLTTDGPHLLVAGTTGAGKSELLQSLLLGLAARRSPADLALVLVDFKGGASFGACGRLPHVVGQVTDLDAGLAGRALAGLRAELHRRERLLARLGAPDVAAVAGHPDAPPRLVVVIDEFRALADDLPEFLPGLLRVAAQGRSLGVHLVLATQRPAGAVSADVRANVSARIALRVVDAADSLDVVETRDAARIPAGVPGRAVLRLASGPPMAFQGAHAGTAPGDGPRVCRAPAWRAAPHRLTDLARSGSALRAVAPPVDTAALLVADLRTAAARRGLTAGRPPWQPPLPDRVTTAEAVRACGAIPAPGALPLALGDDVAHQRRTLVTWATDDGPLAVLGGARSGRTTALVTLAREALARGWHVHALGPRSLVEALGTLVEHPGFGTCAGPDDPRRAARLLRVLADPVAPPGGAPVLLVVDGAEQLRAALTGPSSWDPLAGVLTTPGVAVALTAASASVGGLAPRVGPRLVLLSSDAHADLVLGAPSPLAGTGRTPGRAAWLGADPLACQVCCGGPDGSAPAHRTGPPPVTIRALPRVVSAAGLPEPALPDEVLLGVGGDGAGPSTLDVGAGALVCGPRGSGRTGVLRRVARRLAATGRLAAVVGSDPALRAEAPDVRCAGHSGALRALLDHLADCVTGVVLVDDLDALAQASPLEVERLGALLDAGRGTGVGLVASATVTGALLAHRGPLAELRARRTGVVLHPGERGADEVFGTPLDGVTDPGQPPPGRGALVVAGRAWPLQAAVP